MRSFPPPNDILQALLDLAKFIDTHGYLHTEVSDSRNKGSFGVYELKDPYSYKPMRMVCRFKSPVFRRLESNMVKRTLACKV